jgi:hypothetical protein
VKVPTSIEEFTVPSDLLRPSMIIELIEIIEDLNCPPSLTELLGQLERLLVALNGPPIEKPSKREV